MPYIKQDERDWVRPEARCDAMNPGELNYQFTVLILEYIAAKGLSYQTINDVLGALEGAKLEFYRRTAVPYEDAKLAENGDVTIE